MSLLRLGTMLVLLAGPAACGREAPPQAAAPRPVAVAVVSAGPARPPVATNGIIATREEMRLSFKVGGIVRDISVDAGQRVRGGQVLAMLELAEIESQVEQARQLAVKAERDRARGERLRADEVISEEELEALVTQAEVARAQLRATEFNRRYATIVAPHDGIVLRKLAEAREFVAPGQTVLLLGPIGAGYVARAGLADREVVRLALGDPAEVTVDAWPGVALPGRVTEIAGAADPGSGLFDVEIELGSPEVNLVTGLVARIRIEPAASADARLPHVPVGAVVDADGVRAAVFIVEQGVARRRDVTVVYIGPDTVALSSGVTVGETVVTGGALYLDDGERVEVAGLPSAAPAAAGS